LTLCVKYNPSPYPLAKASLCNSFPERNSWWFLGDNTFGAKLEKKVKLVFLTEVTTRGCQPYVLSKIKRLGP